MGCGGSKLHNSASPNLKGEFITDSRVANFTYMPCERTQKNQQRTAVR